MEIVRTDRPVLSSRADITKEIAVFWNKTSEGFRMAWGPHIHHGYFEEPLETPISAQEKLIEKLVALLDISEGNKILDAGCGMGGSSLYRYRRGRPDRVQAAQQRLSPMWWCGHVDITSCLYEGSWACGRVGV